MAYWRERYQKLEALIKDENQGEQVISWHSKYIWDLLKQKIKTQEDALKLSRLMRGNLHHVLILFSKISEAGYDKFLQKYLHPEYSFVDYRFVKFHPLTGAEKILEKPLDSANKKKNALRYTRVAFEKLEEYKNIENRNTRIWNSLKVGELVNGLLEFLSEGQWEKAQAILLKVFQQLALEAKVTFDTTS